METSKDLKDLNKSPEEEKTLKMARTRSFDSSEKV
jgi:hypothetical protein